MPGRVQAEVKWSGLALVLLTAACGGAAEPQANATISASATPPSAATPSAKPVPSPTPVTPIARVGFACRLPFVRRVDSTHNQAGFITFPAGTFAGDPQAGANAAYYDPAVSRWLPVGREAVAPDGLRYAFTTGGSVTATPAAPRLHVVDAMTASDTTFDLGLPGTQPYGVLRFTAEGVYVGSGWEGFAFGYWRVDPSSGAVVSLGTKQPEFDDGSGHVWRSVVDPRDPNPARSALSGRSLPDAIVRHDLKTGTDETWFYRQGSNVALAGAFVDAGILVWTEPPISASGDGAHEYWAVRAPGRSALVAHIDYGGLTMADSHGIWMGGGDGVYLFTPDGGVRRVYDAAGDPANGCV